MTYTKTDGILTVTRYEATPFEITNTYTMDFLIKQKSDIQAQKDADNADRDREIAEVDALIALLEA